MKRKKRQLTAGLVLMMCLMSAAGCAPNRPVLPANERSFSLDGISEVTISYDEENVTFYESETNELILKEYMTENKPGYHAKVTQHNGSIQISEGGKPLFDSGFSRYIEVYLPSSYQENLTLTTTDGDIDLTALPLKLNSLRVDSTAGTVQLNRAEARNVHLSSTSGTLVLGTLWADMIRLETTSGNVTCERLSGNVTYTTTSGNAEFKSASGSGDYTNSNSGILNVVYTDVSGDLSFYNKNDGVNVVLPSHLEFEFVATTKNGSISTSFQEYIAADGRTARGTVGEHPTVTVRAETNNGDIEISQSESAV